MVSPTKRDVQLAAAFIEIANRYNATGWIEYLLWETIEGSRDRPFALFDLLPVEEMESLRALRDESKLWFFWSGNKWNPVSVEEWRTHAAGTSANDVLQSLMP